MTITYGNRPLITNSQPVLEVSGKQQDHAAFMCWDLFWTLAACRTNAILIHERKEALGERMDANQGHKDWGPAFSRMTELSDQIRNLQAEFLNTERHAQAYWLALSATQRKAEALDTLYGVKATQASIYGMWNRKLSQSPMPAIGLRLDQIALMFAPTPQVAAYLDKETGR